MNELIWDRVMNSKEMQKLFDGEPNIFPDGGRRDDPTAPYIVWQVITDTPLLGLGFKSYSSKVRIQFDVYARSSKLTNEIGVELERIFIGRAIPLLRMGPSPEPGTKLYRRTIDMSFLKKGR